MPKKETQAHPTMFVVHGAPRTRGCGRSCAHAHGMRTAVVAMFLGALCICIGGATRGHATSQLGQLKKPASIPPCGVGGSDAGHRAIPVEIRLRHAHHAPADDTGADYLFAMTQHQELNMTLIVTKRQASGIPSSGCRVSSASPAADAQQESPQQQRSRRARAGVHNMDTGAKPEFEPGTDGTPATFVLTFTPQECHEGIRREDGRLISRHGCHSSKLWSELDGAEVHFEQLPNGSVIVPSIAVHRNNVTTTTRQFVLGVVMNLHVDVGTAAAIAGASATSYAIGAALDSDEHTVHTNYTHNGKVLGSPKHEHVVVHSHYVPKLRHQEDRPLVARTSVSHVFLHPTAGVHHRLTVDTVALPSLSADSPGMMCTIEYSFGTPTHPGMYSAVLRDQTRQLQRNHFDAVVQHHVEGQQDADAVAQEERRKRRAGSGEWKHDFYKLEKDKDEIGLAAEFSVGASFDSGTKTLTATMVSSLAFAFFGARQDLFALNFVGRMSCEDGKVRDRRQSTCVCSGAKNTEGGGGADCDSKTASSKQPYCYVRPGTCDDGKSSKVMQGSEWSALACATQYIFGRDDPSSCPKG